MTSDAMDRRTLLHAALAGVFLAACGTTTTPDEPAPALVDPADPDSNFHRIYDDPALAAKFRLFLQNVFHLVPEEKLHALVAESTAAHATDVEIYAAIQAGLPGITPVGSMVRFALPALKKQKQVMAAQTAALVGAGTTIDGYLEIGTVGRYLNPIGEQLTLKGPVFVVNSEAPSKDIADIVERGQLKAPGTFVPMGDYDPLSADVPDASVDLVTNFIGFHHAPEGRLEGFIGGIRRVLRPGGRLLVREHDVTDETMDTFVALAHDVFNAGTALSWADNAAEIRRFRSVADWVTLLEASGFARDPGAERQAGDPTDNTLLAFRRA